jgi:hypothetical protein
MGGFWWTKVRRLRRRRTIRLTMKPIAIFYHGCFFQNATTPWPLAKVIAWDQWNQADQSGLINAAEKIFVGVNGGKESEGAVLNCTPKKAHVVYHGLDSKNENSTIDLLHRWAKENPGYAILYFHIKGVSKPTGDAFSIAWRTGMMLDCVTNWRQCVVDLECGFDIAASNFFWHMCDGSQNIVPGNFWWAKSDFLASLPSIYERERIKTSGIKALESRYESEVWIGNGRRPNVKTYRTGKWPW